MRQVLAGAVDVTGDLATWSATALGAMVATGQLHVPAGSLTGDQVRDDPRPVEAKLTDRLAPAPPESVTAVTTTLATLTTWPDPSTLGAGGPTLRAAPLDTSVAPPVAGTDPIHRAL